MNRLMERVKAGGRLVVVLRGVSGAGKSTLAKALEAVAARAGSAVAAVSANDYFTGEDGVYRFDPSKLGEAHANCMKRFITTLQVDSAYGVKDSLVVVDNTNTTVAEAAPYMAVGAAYGWETLLVTLDVDPRKAAARNVHGVSARTVDEQFIRIKYNDARLPPFWEHLRVLPDSPPGVEYVYEVPVTLGETLDPAELANRGTR